MIFLLGAVVTLIVGVVSIVVLAAWGMGAAKNVYNWSKGPDGWQEHEPRDTSDDRRIEEVRNNAGLITERRTYNSKNQVVGRKTFQYDTSGMLITEMTYNHKSDLVIAKYGIAPGGLPSSFDPVEVCTYRDGKLHRRIAIKGNRYHFYGPDDKLIGVVEDYYNENYQLLSSRQWYGPEPRKASFWNTGYFKIQHYEYDKHGRFIEVKTFQHGQLIPNAPVEGNGCPWKHPWDWTRP